jgi:hypothetical protein
MPDSWSTNPVFKSAFTGGTSLSTAPLPGIIFSVLSYIHIYKALSMTFTRNFAVNGSLALTLSLIFTSFFLVEQIINSFANCFHHNGV